LSNDIQSAVVLINEHFEMSNTNLSLNDSLIDSMSLLKQKMTELVAYLMEKNLEKLLSAIYRIDVDERKFKEALDSGEDIYQIASNIADLIINRELEKVKYRNLYGKK